MTVLSRLILIRLLKIGHLPAKNLCAGFLKIIDIFLSIKLFQAVFVLGGYLSYQLDHSKIVPLMTESCPISTNIASQTVKASSTTKFI